jgi:ABC-2 type transport system permease protein
MGAKKFIHECKANTVAYREYFWVNFKTVLEYKMSSFIQISAMFLNDVVWISFWWIFFARFPLINGWTYRELLILWSIGALSFGLSGILFGNRSKLGEVIIRGRLDYFLALPKNVLLHALSSKITISAFGDALFGLALGLIIFTPTELPLYIYLAFLSAIILTSFGVIIGSLSFFFSTTEKVNKTIWNATVGLTLYPTNVYDGLAKFLLFVIIPVGFVSGVPTEILRVPSPEGIAVMTIVTIIIALIASLIFYAGIKKYESGNLIYVNA